MIKAIGSEMTEPRTMTDIARELAIVAHAGQTYGDQDYFTGHVQKVVNALYLFKDGDVTDIEECAAYLHDVIEDTEVTGDEIVWRLYGNESEDDPFDHEDMGVHFVRFIVDLVTDPPGENQKERKQKLKEQFLAETDRWIKDGAALVKGCDRYANHAEAIATNRVPKMSMYADEFPEFVALWGPYILSQSEKLYYALHDQYKVLLKRVDAYK